VEELLKRRQKTESKFEILKDKLRNSAAIAEGKACVYVTGSFGRGEAGDHSDLDLFILGKVKPGDKEEESRLSRLDEICLKAELIKACRELSIPEFSGDGRYLTHYSYAHLVKTLGKPEDDQTNTFTARLLLLLESRALIEEAVYNELIPNVVAAYWRDYEDHKDDFMPAFLANDILRLWRTFCVNYEARTERVPDSEKAKGKLKNYKLKHSRLLTCYSAILYLLAVYGRTGTVSPNDVLEMIRISPTERLEWLLRQDDLSSAHGAVESLMNQYDLFLQTTSAPEEELLKGFSDKSISRSRLESASKFGDTLSSALSAIGNQSRFHRLLIV
jgi:predicted nucleotidyltransferase